MAKQILTLGSAVDDGQGDYLRLGGQKINSNFNDVYSELGDDTNLFPAG
jgi:baseplate wedge subunit